MVGVPDRKFSCMSSSHKFLQVIKHVLCQSVPGIGYAEMNYLAPIFEELTVR